MNVHTEDEARSKWCPFVRSLRTCGELMAGINRVSDTDVMAAPCVASRCMAWRWESFASRDNPTREPGAGQSFDRTRGYCGLAGAP